MKIKANFLIWLLVPLLLVGCGAAEEAGGPAPEPDLTPPRIVSFFPPQGAILEPDRVVVQIRFSEAVKDAGLAQFLSVTRDGGQTVAGTWQYDADTFTATFQPDQPFTLDTVVTVTVGSGVADLAGNPLEAGKSWTFGTTRTYALSIRPHGIGAPGGISLTVRDVESGQTITIQSANTQAFPERIREGSPYRLTIEQTTLPDGTELACAIQNPVGTLSADTEVDLYCSPVVPLYPGNGARWNDYVLADGSDTFNASDTACNANPFDACLHGGELRRFPLPSGITDCTDVTIEEQLGAFDWVCRVTADGAVEVVSTGLAEGKGLRDLLDFDRIAWRVNRVRIFQGGAQVADSGEGIWWANPVRRPASVILSEGGTVYLVDAATTPRHFRLYDHVGTALVTAPGVALRPISGNEAVLVSNGGRLWLEVDVDGAGTADPAIHLDNAWRVVLQDVTVAGAAGHGVRIDRSATNPGAAHLLRNVVTHDNGGDGLRLRADQVTLEGLASHGNGGNGLSLSQARDNRIDGLRAAANGGHGLHLDRAHGNLIQHATLYANAGHGLSLEGAQDNRIQGLISAANGGDGIEFIVWNNTTRSAYNLLRQITSAWNVGRGLAFAAFDGGGTQAGDNQILGLAAAGNGGVGLDAGVGNETFAESRVDTCAGTCPAGVTGGLDASTAFVGPVDSDTTNDGDANGQAYANFLTDWIGFDNDYRLWGKAAGANDYSPIAGQCGSTDLCQIYDLSLRADDTQLKDALTLPSGDDTITHTWGDGNDSTFLAHALELDGDGLCEDGELCLYTPNIGAYPGHGPLINQPFTDGVISGVTLKAHQDNGR